MNEYEDTENPSGAQSPPGEGPRRLTRSRDDRFIGGVAAGLADYFSIDPTLVRVAFAVSLAIGGVGVFAYLVLLALVPVEGDPDRPPPPVTGNRRTVAIGGTVLVGVLLLVASLSGGSGTSWLFGFGPGVLFGILLWVLVAAGLIWAVGKAGRPGVQPPPGAAPVTEASTSFAAAPSQTPATAETGVLTGSPGPGSPGAGGAGATTASGTASGSTAASTFGKVMTWLAIAFTGLVLLSILAAISFGITALFGAIPAAVLVIGCGIGVVALALSDRPQMALWTVAAAIAIAIPMAIVSIASLDIEGDWGEINQRPLTAAALPADGYQMAAGALKVDLRDFPFRNGETVDLKTDSGFGATSVIVPDRVCVVGEVEGRAGYIEARGSDSSGVDTNRTLAEPEPQANVPVLRLDSEFRIGYFGVFDDTGWRGTGDNWPEDLENRERADAMARADEACAGTEPRRKPGKRPPDG